MQDKVIPPQEVLFLSHERYALSKGMWDRITSVQGKNMNLAPSETMLRLSSNPGNIRMIESFVYRLAEEHQLSEDQYGKILVSVTEAVNNAIFHGNGLDERKKVLVRAERQDGGLAIVVEDEGNGFDYRKLPDPTAAENLTRIGGRGVFLMFRLCDSVRYRRNGCQVELGFNL